MNRASYTTSTVISGKGSSWPGSDSSTIYNRHTNQKEVIIYGISGNHKQVESQLAKILENAEIELKDNLLIDIYYNGIASRGMTRYNMSVSYMDETKEWSSRVPDIISEEMTLNDNSDEIEVTEACQSFVEGMINEYKTAIIDFVSNVNSLHTHIKPKNKMKLSF